MKIRKRLIYPALVPVTSLAVAACVAPGSALALSYEKGDWLFNVDTTLTAAAQWRTESRDDDLSGPDNNNLNDGNNNFDDGSMTSAKGSFILEVGGEYKNFSFFIRGDGLYDYVYEDKNSDMSEENYLTYNGAIPNGGTVKRGDFPDGTLDEHGSRLRLLDAFADYRFEVGSQFGTIRAGRQVIAWGEALLYTGVNGLQNHIDAAVALSPGVEAKEIFLPSNAVNIKWNFNDYFSAEAYYKLEWEETTQPGVGSFLSPGDITGPGAQRFLAPTGNSTRVASAEKADDFGQWGTALRYVTDYGTNFELSYTKSHANTPSTTLVVDFADLDNSYFRELYPEDIEFWQFSISGIIGEANVYADFVYSDNAPFTDRTPYINDLGQLVFFDAIDDEYRQVVIGMLDTYTAFPWLSEQISLTAEVVYQDNDLASGDKEDPDNPYGITDDAWGYRIIAILNYFSVLPGLDVNIPLSWRHDVDGYGASVLKNSLIEDQKWASAGVKGIYLTNWEFEAKYSWYFGNDDLLEPVLADRDNIALSVKYRF